MIVKNEEKAKHAEYAADDDEADKTVIVSKKGEKLDGATDRACSCGKNEEGGKVEDTVEKGDDGAGAWRVFLMQNAEKKEETEGSKAEEKADIPLRGKEDDKAEAKKAENDGKAEETKEAKKEK
ncbi:uncharacterized protein MYCFIDRAFT_172957 [Pseudocercospora fijiensis CIRAD86]|uniref:Uncharacterized protein n=1 Tax=Pseudocercospora fijiensis (strain CIRAD86) TaxID=383855 RepID=M2ZY50_PSEFD|nr:uncharacterized protein MYCFIDRAFT_172957 [Pseudocercospora fijiensis CIRAD86]EME83879.1 hypothetical protein MYCFIDRAFT_172957 [Pseudocercospora fijiensis CIRAD86]